MSMTFGKVVFETDRVKVVQAVRPIKVLKKPSPQFDEAYYIRSHEIALLRIFGAKYPRVTAELCPSCVGKNSLTQE